MEYDCWYMNILWRVAGLSLSNKVSSLVIWEGLRVEPRVLHMERSQLRWFTHLTGLPRGRFLNEMFQAWPGRRRPWGRYKMYWRDYVSWLVFPRQTGGSGQVSLLRLLPLQTGNDNWPCTWASCTAYRAILVTNAIWYLDESIQLS